PSSRYFFLLSTLRRLPLSTLFPYTTLFRSCDDLRRHVRRLCADQGSVQDRSLRTGALAQYAGNRECAELDDSAASDRSRALGGRSEEHTSELQSRENLVCRLLLEKKKNIEY